MSLCTDQTDRQIERCPFESLVNFSFVIFMTFLVLFFFSTLFRPTKIRKSNISILGNLAVRVRVRVRVRVSISFRRLHFFLLLCFLCLINKFVLYRHICLFVGLIGLVGIYSYSGYRRCLVVRGIVIVMVIVMIIVMVIVIK